MCRVTEGEAGEIGKAPRVDCGWMLPWLSLADLCGLGLKARRVELPLAPLYPIGVFSVGTVTLISSSLHVS